MALTLTSALTKQTASTVGYFLMEYCSTATPVLCPIPTGVLKDLNDNHKCINTQNLYSLFEASESDAGCHNVREVPK